VAVLQKPRSSRNRIGVDSRPFDLEGNHALDNASDQPPPAPAVVGIERDDLDPDPPFDPKALGVALLILAGFWLALGIAIAVLCLTLTSKRPSLAATSHRYAALSSHSRSNGTNLAQRGESLSPSWTV
jgi:hypothetical protein